MIVMMSFADAIDEFGIELADMMLETEYNQYIAGISCHKKNSLYEIEFGVKEDPFFEELYRMEKEF